VFLKNEFFKSCLTFLCFFSFENFSQANASEAKLREMFERSFLETTDSAQVELATEKQNEATTSYFPTIAGTASTTGSKSQGFADSKKIEAGNKAEIDSTARIALTQNLYRSGMDSLKKTIADTELKSVNLQENFEREKFILKSFLDLNDLLGKQKEVQLRTKQKKQADVLLSNAERKSKSGLLSATDLLRTQQEVQRGVSELTQAEQAWNALLNSLTEQYSLAKVVLETEALPSFLVFESFLSEKCTKLRKCTFENTRNNVSLNTELLQNQLGASELQLTSQKKQKFFTTLDFNVGYSLNWKDKVNVAGAAYGAVPNRTQTPFASLDLRIQGFDLKSWAEEKTALQKLSLSKRQLELSQKRDPQKIRQLEESLELQNSAFQNSQKLIATERKIFEKIDRLFQAGEVSVETLLNSQKALNELELSEARQQKEILSHKVKLYFSQTRGVSQE
jgi:Outer membrane efflux protein